MIPNYHTLLLHTLLLATSTPCVAASFYDNPEVNPPPEAGTPLFHLEKKYFNDFGFSGISTFAHLKHFKCLTTPYDFFDIAVIGAPFDTAVTYRPGARFGPRAIRAASARQVGYRSFNHRAGINPYMSWPRIIDCGDIPITPFDNALALYQMESAFMELLSRRPLSIGEPPSHIHPKIVTLGGDHSVALPALRALYKTYKKPIAVLHFDAHLDTWHPQKYPSAWVEPDEPSQADFTHGTMFWLASKEGLIKHSRSVHAGLRTRLSGDDYADYVEDDNLSPDEKEKQGFLRIESDDIDSIGVQGVIDTIMKRMGTKYPVYLSVDIDVIDPGIAPGTGTPEPGGWTTREMIQILRGIENLNLVGADIVEVAPAYDDRGEGTALAAAQIVFEMLTSMVKRGVKERGEWDEKVKTKPVQEWKRKLEEKAKAAKNGGVVENVKGKVAKAEDKVKSAAGSVAAGATAGGGGLMDRIQAAYRAFEEGGGSAAAAAAAAPAAAKEEMKEGEKPKKDEL